MQTESVCSRYRNSVGLLLLFAFTLTSCGYIGAPLPPTLDIPLAVKDLRATEQGDKVIINFTKPELNTDGIVPKEIAAIELRAGKSNPGDFNVDVWAASAQLIDVPKSEKLAVKIELPAADWVGQEVVMAVRTQGHRRRFSQWSNFVVIPVIAPLSPPAQLAAKSDMKGVALTWQATADAEYRIFRGDTLLAKTKQASYMDTTAEVGKSYTYTAQSFRVLNERQQADSLVSKPLEFTLADTFPPAVPAGVGIISGSASIELSWNRNLEPDWKLYRIWRAEGDAPLAILAQEVTSTSYSDRTAVRGKRYRYAVSSVDTTGNESEKSQPQEFTLPE